MMVARKVGWMCVALVVALAGCSAKKPGKSDDQRTASGQVLPGSISDAMLPYDALTSQAPVAPLKTVAGAGDAGEADSAAPDAPEAGPAAPAAGN